MATVKLQQDGFFSISSESFTAVTNIDFDFFDPHCLCFVHIDDGEAVYDILVEPVFMSPDEILVTVDGGVLGRYIFELQKT